MKLGFNETQIKLQVPISGDIRITLSELSYNSKITFETLKVPTGFKTDLGSIPQILQGIFPKDGKAMFAYILHDWLYYIGDYTQKQCDDILEEAMQTLGVVFWRRKAIRNGLRVGGFIAYNNHRKRDGK